MFTSILCINLSEHKFYVYSLNGILLHRREFKKKIEKYGEIIAISDNGQNVLLQNKKFEKQINLIKSA